MDVDRDLRSELLDIAKPHIGPAVWDTIQKYRHYHGRNGSCQCWPNPCPDLREICIEVARDHFRQIVIEAVREELKQVISSPARREYWRQLLGDAFSPANREYWRQSLEDLFSPPDGQPWRQFLEDIWTRVSLTVGYAPNNHAMHYVGLPCGHVLRLPNVLLNKPVYCIECPEWSKEQTFTRVAPNSVITVRCLFCHYKTQTAYSYISRQPLCGGCHHKMHVPA